MAEARHSQGLPLCHLGNYSFMASACQPSSLVPTRLALAFVVVGDVEGGGPWIDVVSCRRHKRTDHSQPLRPHRVACPVPSELMACCFNCFAMDHVVVACRNLSRYLRCNEDGHPACRCWSRGGAGLSAERGRLRCSVGRNSPPPSPRLQTNSDGTVSGPPLSTSRSTSPPSVCVASPSWSP